MVVYNLTRFAREKYESFALRAHLKSLGISLRSATEPIDDTSTGRLMEKRMFARRTFPMHSHSSSVGALTMGGSCFGLRTRPNVRKCSGSSGRARHRVGASQGNDCHTECLGNGRPPRTPIIEHP